MLFMFELILAIIIVAIRHYIKNKEKYGIKIKRFALKIAASILALLLTVTVLLQELFQQMLNKISKQENKLKLLDKTYLRKRGK